MKASEKASINSDHGDDHGDDHDDDDEHDDDRDVDDGNTRGHGDYVHYCWYDRGSDHVFVPKYKNVYFVYIYVFNFNFLCTYIFIHEESDCNEDCEHDCDYMYDQAHDHQQATTMTVTQSWP